MKTSTIVILITTILLIISAIFFRIACVKFVESHELGYKFNANTGQTTILTRTGYIVHKPIIEEIHVIDLRPVQVCLNANSRVLNCKLVRFNPKGLTLFLSWHGRADYVMFGTDGTRTSTFVEILKSYAYDGSDNTEEKYPFLEIMPSNNETRSNTPNRVNTNAKADTTANP